MNRRDGPDTLQGDYITELTRIVNENLSYFQETFPNDLDWSRWPDMSAASLPLNVVKEAIRMEAEQR